MLKTFLIVCCMFFIFNSCSAAEVDLNEELGTAFGMLLSREQPIEQLISSWDRNHDGFLDATDLAAVYKRFFMHRRPESPAIVPAASEMPPAEQFEKILRIWDPSVSTSPARISLSGIIDSIKAALHRFYPVADIEEIHLALTGNPTQMSVSWSTPTRPTLAQVHYGLEPSNLSSTVSGNITSYKTHNKVLGLLGFGYIYTGWISQATMTDLPADSTIYYVCSNGSSVSPVQSFRSPPSQSRPTRFVALGDQGTFYPVGFKVAQQIADIADVDMVLHAGDLAYAGTSGSADGREIEQIWDYWGRQNQVFSGKYPYMLTVGNHEQFYNYTSFIHRFYMPQNGAGSFWYSYDAGYFHVLSFSSEQSYLPGSEQYAFIVADLEKASANLQNVPWIVAVDHRPLYCSDEDEWGAHNGDPATSQLSRVLEPLFLQYRVNVVISGHMHVFERSFPVFNATTPYGPGDNVYAAKQSPPVYITVGSGGIFLDWKWIQPQPVWSAFRASEWGVAIVEANATSLHYQFESTLGRQIQDEFWLNY